MKRILTIFTIILAVWQSMAQVQPKTYQFAERDTCKLYLDIYKPDAAVKNGYSILFVFGGGFIMGERNSKSYIPYYQKLTEKGYSVVAIDYRLGLKGANMRGVHAVSSLDHAIQVAVEDLFSATRYLIDNADKLQIDASKIVLCGSSAGAITVLQGDYELCNRSELAKALPCDFHFAGVMSFSGAIYSHDGALKYKERPAPTFILHGKEDRLVPYKSIRFGKLGFFGGSPIIKRFEKFNYPYMAYRYEGLGHEVAGLMLHNAEICDWFIQQFIVNQQNMQIDATLNDGTVKANNWGRMKAGDLY